MQVLDELARAGQRRGLDAHAAAAGAPHEQRPLHATEPQQELQRLRVGATGLDALAHGRREREASGAQHGPAQRRRRGRPAADLELHHRRQVERRVDRQRAAAALDREVVVGTPVAASSWRPARCRLRPARWRRRAWTLGRHRAGHLARRSSSAAGASRPAGVAAASRRAPRRRWRPARLRRPLRRSLRRRSRRRLARRLAAAEPRDGDGDHQDGGEDAERDEHAALRETAHPSCIGAGGRSVEGSAGDRRRAPRGRKRRSRSEFVDDEDRAEQAIAAPATSGFR